MKLIYVCRSTIEHFGALKGHFKIIFQQKSEKLRKPRVKNFQYLEKVGKYFSNVSSEVRIKGEEKQIL